MHIFLTGLFESVVLGIAIILLIASLELRNGDRTDYASPRADFDDEQMRRTGMRKPIYAGALNAQHASNRADDSDLDFPADRPVGRPFAATLILS